MVGRSSPAAGANKQRTRRGLGLTKHIDISHEEKGVVEGAGATQVPPPLPWLSSRVSGVAAGSGNAPEISISRILNSATAQVAAAGGGSKYDGRSAEAGMGRCGKWAAPLVFGALKLQPRSKSCAAARRPGPHRTHTPL